MESLLYPLGREEPRRRATASRPLCKRNELFTDLLYEMGTALGYDFDKTDISKEVYSTVHQETLEIEGQIIRTKLVEILTGKAALPMAVVHFPNDPETLANQAEYLKIMAQYLREGKPLPVTIIDDANAGKVVPMRPADPQSERKTG